MPSNIKQLVISLCFIGLLSSCVNLQSVQDFGTASKTFGTSYDEVYYGAYNTCIASRELNHIKSQVAHLENFNPENQSSEDEKFCESWKEFGGIYKETALALADFGSALDALATKGNMDFKPQFTEITENLSEITENLSISPTFELQKENVDKVNFLAQILLRSYIKNQAAMLIRDSEKEVLAALELLKVLSDIYEEQLNTYRRNINDVSKLIIVSETEKSLVLQFLVRDNLNKYKKRKELLENYATSLDKVGNSYSELLQRAKLPKPHFDDPVFQKKMQDFLINIIKLVQESKIINN